MIRYLACGWIGLLGLIGGCGHLDMDAANKDAPAGTGFSVHQVMIDGSVHKYGLFIPLSYRNNTPTPAIMFLHGVLQAGSDGVTEMSQGLGPNIARQVNTFPFIAIFPQSSGDWTGDSRDKLAMAVLDDVESKYAVDKDRIILTGLSNGGYGVWHIGANHTDRFAALVPVSGKSDTDSVDRLTHIPIWVFHNSGDFLILSSNSRDMVSKLKAAGANVQYTQFDAVGHECWDQVYGDPKVIDWMLAQRRGH